MLICKTRNKNDAKKHYALIKNLGLDEYFSEKERTVFAGFLIAVDTTAHFIINRGDNEYSTGLSIDSRMILQTREYKNRLFVRLRLLTPVENSMKTFSI